tara:strand:- start:669 stop:902 length:234 start_codon:yes stop_codon:yes gene_type:complete
MVELYKEITNGFYNYCLFLSILFVLSIWVGFISRLIFSSYMDEIISKRASKDPLIKAFMDNSKNLENKESDNSDNQE